MPSRPSASSADFTSHATFTAPASSSHPLRCGRYSAVTARASPTRHARPTVSSANSPSARFEGATATGAPAAASSHAVSSPADSTTR